MACGQVKPRNAFDPGVTGQQRNLSLIDLYRPRNEVTLHIGPWPKIFVVDCCLDKQLSVVEVGVRGREDIVEPFSRW